MEIVKTYMNAPISIESNSDLFQVIKKLIEEKKSRLVVTTEGRITGIVSEKDIANFLVSDSSERKLDKIQVSEISKKIMSIDENTELNECAQKMLQQGIGSLAVSSKGKIVGITTKSDLVQYFSKKHTGDKIVGEYMSPYYAWQYSDASLSKIVQKMIDEKISRMIIREKNENPVGIITFKDLFNLSLKLGEEEDVLDNSDPLISVVFPQKGFVSESGFGATTTASEIMRKNIVCVQYGEDLAKTGKILLENNINGAGVLSTNDSLIGIISKTDIVKSLAFLK